VNNCVMTPADQSTLSLILFRVWSSAVAVRAVSRRRLPNTWCTSALTHLVLYTTKSWRFRRRTKRRSFTWLTLPSTTLKISAQLLYCSRHPLPLGRRIDAVTHWHVRIISSNVYTPFVMLHYAKWPL